MSLFHLIAPSGYCIKQHAALRGIQRLTDEGIRSITSRLLPVVVSVLRVRKRAHGRSQFPCQTDHPNTIVLAVRGGYGASRLLADIDWQALVARQQYDPLLICGHSDFTAIQCGLLAQGNVITFSGPMLVANFGADELNAFTEHHFWLALRNETFTIEWQGEGPTCQTEGTLWGGNLAMLISLIGTPWMPKIENGILVLEDINEHPFRVERMLLQLYHAGILPRQKAIILGSFSGSTPNDYDAGYNSSQCTRFCVPACRFHSLPASILVMNNARLRCRWAHMPF